MQIQFDRDDDRDGRMTVYCHSGLVIAKVQNLLSADSFHAVILFGILGNYLFLFIWENFSKILGK